MADLTGQVLRNRYRIEALIGRGGMAEVYRAWDMRRQYHVAIKVMREDLAEDMEFVARFRGEAQALAALAHANIVRFYSFERAGRLAFIVMEYVHGTTLRGRIFDAEGQPLPLPEVALVLKQVCSALHFAHSGNVLHRDIKPGNIMLQADPSGTSAGRVLVADFGIAKAADAATATTVMPGTPAYMSPEQCRSQLVDARTDVYSLGVVAYEMLTGRRPFVGDSKDSGTGSTRERIRWEQIYASPPPLRRFNRAVSPQVERVVLTALSKDRDDRWPTIQAFWQALESALGLDPRVGVAVSGSAALASEPAAPGPQATAGGRRPTWSERLPTWAWVTGAVVLAALLLLIVAGRLIVEPGTPSSPPAQVGAALTEEEPAPADDRPVTETPTPPENTRTPTTTATSTARVEAEADTPPTWTPSVTATRTPTPSLTPTPSPTATATPSPSPTPGPSLVGITAGNASKAELLMTLTGHALDVLGVAFSPDGRRLASASDDKTIRLWKSGNGNLQAELTRHTDTVYSVAYSPDGQRLASGSRDNTVRLWRASDGSLERTLTGHEEKVWCVAYSPDGDTVASGSGDRTARVWRASDGQLLHSLAGHSKPIYGIAYSPDGRTLATASADNTIRLWQVENGQHLLTLSGHTERVRSVAFSPDSNTLASASLDRTIRLWRTSDGQPIRNLTGHGGEVLSVAFGPEGKILGSASQDRTVRLWRVDDGRQLSSLTGHESRVTSIAFSHDGKRLASASDDRTVKLWGVWVQ